ncbi:MAG TPA: universal stress protein [Polyangiaceae bacterium]|nr:universal stress protein [Polyangiaceae bacterium]
MNTIARILVPIDFLPHSADAVRRALDFASKYDADVTLLHVYEPAAYPVTPGDIVYDRDRLERASVRVRARLDAVRRDIDPAGRRRISIRVIQGTPARAILDTASEGQFDLIVMGTHGRTGVDRLMSGSVAEDVLRRAPCPVLTLKSGPEPTPRGLANDGFFVSPAQPIAARPIAVQPITVQPITAQPLAALFPPFGAPGARAFYKPRR